MKRYKNAVYVGLPIFLIFAISIMLNAGWIHSFDSFFQNMVRSIPNLKDLMLKITLLAAPKVDLIWMVLIAVILWFKKMRPLATSIVLTLVSADAVGWIVKHLIQRSRPVGHLAIDDGFSFPSGHTLGMGIIVIWLMMVLIPKLVKNRTYRVWIDVVLVIWLVIVMYSRVYVLAHYPTDVCASVALALTWVGVAQICLKELAHKLWNVDIL
ncbi:phosphatase PAP2 family protein [Lactobacillus hominis]|uniref:Membrane-associated phospholipid phosphatase n=1 Tax=Lactobacillus hominis DSM 23910 = CRBIP 24.179 TaxID=1423758 RepID=I7L663_9LACO|nr:phosphatase PAP2 family protein [Lactobacillus hominis]KRM85646.1 membrane-associated phospholipid phosphatase [Lactobacillus hominis DSM 23910 = CRBIP 24.179]MCT3347304.1 phosphatase PAP2 family protein [Lactobacillus hominis]CCI81832.1 Membrane-associated phospholipid phosphatase [Lactobacillus hominis DSM 23910 = CRBIP 24.179]